MDQASKSTRALVIVGDFLLRVAHILLDLGTCGRYGTDVLGPDWTSACRKRSAMGDASRALRLRVSQSLAKLQELFGFRPVLFLHPCLRSERGFHRGEFLSPRLRRFNY